SKADFIQATQRLLAQSSSPRELASTFNPKLKKAWILAEVGFAVDLNGSIHSPQVAQGQTAATFLSETGRFLSNRENVPVFSTANVLNNQQIYQQALVPKEAIQNQLQGQSPVQSSNASQSAQSTQILRQVTPQKSFASQDSNFSSAVAAESDF